MSGEGLEIHSRLGAEPTVGTQAALRLEGAGDSVLVTVTEIGRATDGEAWRLALRFREPQPALIDRARALLARA